MSELRNQLEQTRRAYVAARYPGDLADDVLMRHEHSTLRWLAASAASSAVAAALVLAWMLFRGTPPRSQIPFTLIIPADEPQPVSLVMPPMPEMPVGLNFAIPALPQMPSLDALREAETTSTTQEAV